MFVAEHHQSMIYALFGMSRAPGCIVTHKVHEEFGLVVGHIKDIIIVLWP